MKYFEKAYEYQNFSEASRLLFISQSTLSQQIKQLEEELDILLFDRIGKRVVPTEATVHEEPDLVKIPILSVERLATQGFLFWPQGVYRKKSTLAFAEFLQQVIAPHKH